MSDIGILVTPEETTERTRVVLDYTSRDFAAIRSQLIGLARGFMPEWETVGEAADFGTLLLELFAYMGDSLHFYIDRTSSEAFLGTAVRRASVLYIADMFGYNPIGQQAATVKLQFKMDADAEEDVTLPKGTHIHNAAENADNLIVFETENEIILKPGDPNLAATPPRDGIVYATEGITVKDGLLGTGMGMPNADFTIPDKGVVYGSVSVISVEGGRTVPWSYTSDLSLARPTQSMFTTYQDDLELTHLVFGDNAAGRVPPVNSELYVTYRFGVGAEANDLEAGSITTIVPPPGVDTWGVSVTNPGKPLGGTDPETLESMRYSIPRAAGRIKQRAVTLNDYADLALQVPGVAKSISHGTVYTAIYVRIAPVGGAADDAYMNKLCAAVEAFMADKVMVGSTVYAEPRTLDVIWRNIYIQMLVHVQEGYNRTQVRLAVDSALRALLSFDRVDFGYSVTIGEIYRTALAVSGVEWVDVTHLSTERPLTAAEGGGSVQGGEQIVHTVWRYDSSTNISVDPGSGRVRTDTPATAFTISSIADDGTQQAAALGNVAIGDHILVRQRTDASRWWSAVITGPLVNNGTWFSFPITGLDSSEAGPPGNNMQVLVFIARYEIQEEGLVANIMSSVDDGTNLLIPRIALSPPIKEAEITTVVLAANVATLTVSPHEMVVGETIDVTGVTPTEFNGQFVITAVTPTTLSYAKTNADIASVASEGMVHTVNLPESEEEYPDLEEEERTHDGLWVQAVGGLVNT